MTGFDDPRLRPVWLRILLVAVCVGWGLFELVSGSIGFALVFLGFGAYLGWRLLVTYSPDTPEDRP